MSTYLEMGRAYFLSNSSFKDNTMKTAWSQKDCMSKFEAAAKTVFKGKLNTSNNYKIN